MNQTPKISVIVAAYNAERYIGRCLDSILAQTMSDFEIIVVNDGSTDGTPAILDGYASKDSRVHVIHKENGGVASARQAGLDAAQGEYTIHADSDDWVEPEMLEEMYAAACANHSDMVFCDFYEIHKDQIKYNSQRPESYDRLTIFGQTFNILSGSLCNKLIKRTCFLDYQISFEQGVNYEEDKLVCLKILSHDIVVTYLEKAFYHYDLVQNSASLSSIGKPLARVDILERIAQYCDISPVQSYYDRAILYNAYQSLVQARVSNKEFVSVFKPYTPNIRRAKGFPLRVKVLVLLRLCGIDISLDRLKHFFHK